MDTRSFFFPAGTYMESINFLSKGNNADLLYTKIYGIEKLDTERQIRTKSLFDYLTESKKYHYEALKIIDNCWENNNDYCLLLRNFSFSAIAVESQPRSIPDKEQKNLNIFESFELSGNHFVLAKFIDSKIKNFIINTFSQKMDTIIVRNPDDIIAPSHPEIFISTANWVDIVENFVAAAQVIVVFIEKWTDGVAQEIEIIKNKKKQNNTIILIQKADEHDEVMDIFKSITNSKEISEEPPSLDLSLMLSEFKNIIYINESDLNEGSEKRQAIESAMLSLSKNDSLKSFRKWPENFGKEAVSTEFYTNKIKLMTEYYDKAKDIDKIEDAHNLVVIENHLYTGLGHAFELGDYYFISKFLLKIGITQLKFYNVDKIKHGISNLQWALFLFNDMGDVEKCKNCILNLSSANLSIGELEMSKKYIELFKKVYTTIEPNYLHFLNQLEAQIDQTEKKETTKDTKH